MTKEALQGMSTLRLRWNTVDTSNEGLWSQYRDKAAGAQTARLSLFLSLYAASAMVNHALSADGSRSPNATMQIENAVGALMIIGGCLPFAMSTSGKPRTPDPLDAMERGSIHELSDLAPSVDHPGPDIPRIVVAGSGSSDGMSHPNHGSGPISHSRNTSRTSFERP